MADHSGYVYTTHNYDEINRHIEESYLRDRAIRRTRQAKTFATYALYSSLIIAGIGLCVLLILLGISFLGDKKEVIPPAIEPIVNIFMGSSATPQSDNIIGTNNADKLNGAGGDDTIDGKKGNDILAGGLDNDTIDGGNGYDTVLFVGKREEYEISFRDELIIVNDTHNGRDGTDTLKNIESLQFSDVTVTAEQVNLDEAIRIVDKSDQPASNTLPDFSFSIFEHIERTTKYTVYLGREFSSHKSLASRKADLQWCYITTVVDQRFGNVSTKVDLVIMRGSKTERLPFNNEIAKKAGVSLDKLKSLQKRCFKKMQYYGYDKLNT